MQSGIKRRHPASGRRHRSASKTSERASGRRRPGDKIARMRCVSRVSRLSFRRFAEGAAGATTRDGTGLGESRLARAGEALCAAGSRLKSQLSQLITAFRIRIRRHDIGNRPRRGTTAELAVRDVLAVRPGGNAVGLVVQEERARERRHGRISRRKMRY